MAFSGSWLCCARSVEQSSKSCEVDDAPCVSLGNLAPAEGTPPRRPRRPRWWQSSAPAPHLQRVGPLSSPTFAEGGMASRRQIASPWWVGERKTLREGARSFDDTFLVRCSKICTRRESVLSIEGIAASIEQTRRSLQGQARLSPPSLPSTLTLAVQVAKGSRQIELEKNALPSRATLPRAGGGLVWPASNSRGRGGEGTTSFSPVLAPPKPELAPPNHARNAEETKNTGRSSLEHTALAL